MLSSEPTAPGEEPAASFRFKGPNHMPAARHCTCQPVEEGKVDEALSMLVEALRIVDAQKISPEVGARLQGVIDDLRSYRSK